MESNRVVRGVYGEGRLYEGEVVQGELYGGRLYGGRLYGGRLFGGREGCTGWVRFLKNFKTCHTKRG